MLTSRLIINPVFFRATNAIQAVNHRGERYLGIHEEYSVRCYLNNCTDDRWRNMVKLAAALTRFPPFWIHCVVINRDARTISCDSVLPVVLPGYLLTGAMESLI